MAFGPIRALAPRAFALAPSHPPPKAPKRAKTPKTRKNPQKPTHRFSADSRNVRYSAQTAARTDLARVLLRVLGPLRGFGPLRRFRASPEVGASPEVSRLAGVSALNEVRRGTSDGRRGTTGGGRPRSAATPNPPALQPRDPPGPLARRGRAGASLSNRRLVLALGLRDLLGGLALNQARREQLPQRQQR